VERTQHNGKHNHLIRINPATFVIAPAAMDLVGWGTGLFLARVTSCQIVGPHLDQIWSIVVGLVAGEIASAFFLPRADLFQSLGVSFW